MRRKIYMLFILLSLLFASTSKSGMAVVISDNVSIGGIAAFVYSDQDKKADGTSGNSYYEIHPLYVFSDINLNDQVNVFIETEYEHQPEFKGGAPVTGAGEIKTDRTYIQTSISDEINFMFGRFFTNFGPWASAHWRVITPTYDRIISMENKYVPSHQTGIQFFGRKPLSEDLGLKYFLWNSLGPELSGTNNRKGGSFNNWGTELIVTSTRDYNLGIAAYKQINPSKKNRKENHYNIFGSATLDNLTLTSEYTKGNLGSGDDGTNYDDVNTFYAGGEYKIGEDWSTYYRFDTGRDEKRSGMTGANAKTDIHAFALTWRPFAGYRIKAEYLDYNFKANALTDYKQTIISAGVVF